MSLSGRREALLREQRERRDLIRELTAQGSWPALAGMSDDQAEERERLRDQLQGVVDAAEAVLAAAEPFAVGNHEVPTGLLDALAKAAGVPTLSER